MVIGKHQLSKLTRTWKRTVFFLRKIVRIRHESFEMFSTALLGITHCRWNQFCLRIPSDCADNAKEGKWQETTLHTLHRIFKKTRKKKKKPCRGKKEEKFKMRITFIWTLTKQLCLFKLQLVSKFPLLAWLLIELNMNYFNVDNIRRRNRTGSGWNTLSVTLVCLLSQCAENKAVT